MATRSVVVIACGGGLGVLSWCAWRYVRKLNAALSEEKRLRLEERRGRTRAEVSLRNLKKLEHRRIGSGSLAADNSLIMRRIGVVRSAFVKRAGTPRQGTVCPSSRGVVVLDAEVATAAALDGLDSYSHAWIIFEFHANTDDPSKIPSKVCPPRGYGERVGWLATRTPHRANPVGLSLVRIVRVNVATLEIFLSGLDLCDGTPVFDVKPYVPWDAPPEGDRLAVPSWVSANDTLQHVEWTPQALSDLWERSAGFPEYYFDDEGDAKVVAKSTISEILRQDPRNKRQRNATRGKKGEASPALVAEYEAPYKISFAHLEVLFSVNPSKSEVTVLSLTPADPTETDKLKVSTVTSSDSH